MSGIDLGIVELAGTLTGAVVIETSAGLVVDPVVAPTYRIYGTSDKPMAAGQGSLTKLDTGTVTGATQATPIVVTSTAHGLQTGTPVTISGVLGNTSANGAFAVARIDANTFSLQGSSGNGAYTSGGSWHVTGLYRLSVDVAAGDGYEAGEAYTAIVTWQVNSDSLAAACPFRVV